jgi:hypothetical protein
MVVRAGEARAFQSVKRVEGNDRAADRMRQTAAGRAFTGRSQAMDL